MSYFGAYILAQVLTNWRLMQAYASVSNFAFICITYTAYVNIIILFCTVASAYSCCYLLGWCFDKGDTSAPSCAFSCHSQQLCHTWLCASNHYHRQINNQGWTIGKIALSQLLMPIMPDECVSGKTECLHAALTAGCDWQYAYAFQRCKWKQNCEPASSIDLVRSQAS